MNDYMQFFNLPRYGQMSQDRSDRKQAGWARLGALGRGMAAAALSGNWFDGGPLLAKALDDAAIAYKNTLQEQKMSREREEEKRYRDEERAHSRKRRAREDRELSEQDRFIAGYTDTVASRIASMNSELDNDPQFNTLPPEQQASVKESAAKEIAAEAAASGVNYAEKRASIDRIDKITGGVRKSFGTPIDEAADIANSEKERNDKYFDATGIRAVTPEQKLARDQWFSENSSMAREKTILGLEADQLDIRVKKMQLQEATDQAAMSREFLAEALKTGDYVINPTTGRPVENPLLKRNLPGSKSLIMDFLGSTEYAKLQEAIHNKNMDMKGSAAQALRASGKYTLFRNTTGIDVLTESGNDYALMLMASGQIDTVARNVAKGRPPLENLPKIGEMQAQTSAATQAATGAPQAPSAPGVVSRHAAKSGVVQPVTDTDRAAITAAAHSVRIDLPKETATAILMKMRKDGTPINTYTMLMELQKHYGDN